jgi:hypothetical protein
LCVIGEFLHPHASGDQPFIRFPQLGQRPVQVVIPLSIIRLTVGGSP